MNRISVFALLIALAAPAAAYAEETQQVAMNSTPSSSAEEINEDYLIGKEDVLELSVFKYAELGGPVTVRPDGRITLKLVGDIQAQGRSVAEVQNEISEKLKSYIPEPHVTLSVREVRSMKVFVTGRVGAPGVFTVGNNVTFLQAVAMAKGFTPWAKKNRIVLVRGETGKRVKVRYDKVVAGKQDNYTLYPGDTIVVP